MGYHLSLVDYPHIDLPISVRRIFWKLLERNPRRYSKQWHGKTKTKMNIDKDGMSQDKMKYAYKVSIHSISGGKRIQFEPWGH